MKLSRKLFFLNSTNTFFKEKLHLAPLLFSLIVSTTFITSSMKYSDITYDEGAFYKWSHLLVKSGITDRPHRHYHSKTPTNIINVLSNNFIEYFNPKMSWQTRLFARRLGGLLWFFIALFFSYKLSRFLIGPKLSAIVVSLIALEPSVMAHCGVITSDASLMAATLCFLYYWIRYFRDSSYYNALLVGLGLGFLLTAKVSGIVVLFFTIISTPILVFFLKGKSIKVNFQTFFSLLLIFFISAIFINTAYFWSEVGHTFQDIKLLSKYNDIIKKYFGNIILPFPKAYIQMLDRAFFYERSLVRNVVILLKDFPDGVWYYFPIHILLKSPLSFLILFFTSIFLFLQKINKQNVIFYFLLFFLISILFYFCFIFRNHKGYRYILMLIPLIYICVFSILSKFKISFKIYIALIIATILEIIPYYGNNLAFTNNLILEKKNAYKYITDSSIAWGQNRRKIRDWAKKNNISKVRISPKVLLEGINIINLNHLTGVIYHDRYIWLRNNMKPTDHVFYTFFVFNLSKKQYIEYIKSR